MYLDNAATTFPKPEPVYRETERFLRQDAGNPGRSGHRLAVAAARAVTQTRQALARLFHAPDSERIAFTANCTESLNLALKGVLRPGDRVVTTSMEHNSVVRPLRRLQQQGIAVEVVAASPAGEVDTDAVAQALKAKTRMVVVNHGSNVCGAVQPIGEIGALCRAAGAVLLVDAAQTAGTLPIDMRRDGIGLLAVPGHKGLLGPAGTGALCFNEDVDPEPLKEGGTGSVSESPEQPREYPDRLESGTLNTVGIAGLGAGLGFLEATGIAVVHAREAALADRLRAGLREIAGVRVVGPQRDGGLCAVVSIVIDGWDPSDAALVLDERFDIQCRPGLHCAPAAHRTLGTFPAGTVRFSPGFFNTPEEMDAAVEAVREIAASGG